jgi:hypothetical protein
MGLPRVVFLVGHFQILLRDVYVDLRGLKSHMTQHLLDMTGVRTVRDQVRGERVAKSVWRNRESEFCMAPVSGNDAVDHQGVHPLPRNESYKERMH